MAIYIKGAELPKSCWSCWRCTSINIVDCAISLGEESSSDFRNTRHPDCPLVEVKEPHGRLIDESVAYDKIAEQETGYYMDMDGVDRGLQDTPTVIEGSE